jgi:hypothetical protein
VSRLLYGALFAVGLALFVVAGWYRRNSADAPGWLYLVALVVIPILIWADRRQGRSKR